MQDAVEPSPPIFEVARYCLDLARVRGIQLQDFGGIRQPTGTLLGERPASPEAGEHHIGPLLLGDPGHRERDALGSEHPGDQELLLLEQHRR
jgi:hypothetical protein